MPDLSVDLNGLELANPVIAASGTCGYGLELTDFVDLGRLGGICVKGISLRPHEGNPPPRIVETPAGMLNAIGLQNVGAEAVAAEKLPRLRELGLDTGSRHRRHPRARRRPEILLRRRRSRPGRHRQLRRPDNVHPPHRRSGALVRQAGRRAVERSRRYRP